MGFLLSLACNTLLSRLFLGWAQKETDTQIGKMQDAAFDTPGAQSALPPSVLIGAGGLLAGQWALARRVLRLSGGQAVAALLLGGAIAGLWTAASSMKE